MTYTTHCLAPTRLTTALMLALSALPSLAQQAPDAGRLLQQDRAAPTLPKTSPGIQIAPPLSAASLPGGQTVSLKSVRFSGNTLFGNDQLSAVLNAESNGITAQPYDLAGLRTLAQKLTDYYRAAGYPFARALIPEQKFADGVLQITVVEGRYGKVSAAGDVRFTTAAQAFLGDLVPGAVIESSRLERTTLILSDQPGIQITPFIRPGEEVGTGDLVVQVVPTQAVRGEVGLDNQGNRYTGEYRARASLQWDSPFMLGDQITVRGNVSDEKQWLGNLGYNLPLGASGLRGNVGYAHSYYQLAQQFASLDATGTADIASVGLTYPLIRSQKTNLSLAGTYQDKKLKDQQRSTNTRGDKKSQVLPLTLQFDRRDGVGGGGITYGSLGYTSGQLDLDAALQTADAGSAKTQGHFSKWNLDVARVQATPIDNLSVFGRVSAQWARQNLDSSEDFGLGGPNGVRAYPGGEGFGDEGWLMQIEARTQMGSFAPYAFYDAGQVKVNKNTWPGAGSSNDRKLSGFGLGVRYSDNAWSLDAAVAWRDRGGKPMSDTTNTNLRLWMTAGWRF